MDLIYKLEQLSNLHVQILPKSFHYKHPNYPSSRQFVISFTDNRYFIGLKKRDAEVKSDVAFGPLVMDFQRKLDLWEGKEAGMDLTIKQMKA